MLPAESSTMPKGKLSLVFEPAMVAKGAKGQRRYRYYVSRKLVRGAPEDAEHDAEHGWRVSAPEIERAVCAAAKGMLPDRVTIA